MEPYNFLADLLDTYQSSPGWVQALWVMAVPGFALGVLALLLRFILMRQRLRHEVAVDAYLHDVEEAHYLAHARDPTEGQTPRSPLLLPLYAAQHASPPKRPPAGF